MILLDTTDRLIVRIHLRLLQVKLRGKRLIEKENVKVIVATMARRK